MATNFWINWLCANDSDYAIGYGGGLSVGQENGDIADTLQQRDVAMATIFVFLYVWCTLAPPGEYD